MHTQTNHRGMIERMVIGVVAAQDLFDLLYAVRRQYARIKAQKQDRRINHREKPKGDKVLESEIPEVEPKDGYHFVGWDKKPNNHVVTEDVTFVAQYEEIKESWWSRFWGWGSGCLNWLLLLLLLALIGLLLWYLLGSHNFNFCGCDCGCNEIVVVHEHDTVQITPEQEIDIVDEDTHVVYDDEPCGVDVSPTSGGDEGVIQAIDMGQTSGSFLFEYNTYTAKDRIKIFNGKKTQGVPIFKYEGGTDGKITEMINFNSSDGYITIVVEAIDSGTVWDFKVNCPE